jgi:hypothetical protein
LARRDQEKEEELAKKASSKSARQAAKVNRLALQQTAAEKREVDRNRRETEKERRPKSWLKGRERERKLGLSHHPQRRGNNPLSQD